MNRGSRFETAVVPVTKQVARRYVQLHTTDDVVDGLPTAQYDGIAEVWVDDITGAAAVFASGYSNPIIAADEENVLGRSKTAFLSFHETVIGHANPRSALSNFTSHEPPDKPLADAAATTIDPRNAWVEPSAWWSRARSGFTQRTARSLGVDPS